MKRLLMFGAVAVCALLFYHTIDLVFYGTPLERNDSLYINQKIFYYHVPQAFVLFISVIVCGVASLYFIKRREGRYDDIARSAGELSVVFGAMMLISGSIWAKASWGYWWAWDFRLSSSLLLWLLMVGYVLVRKYGGLGSERLAAGLAIFGAVDIPLVYFSVKVWETQHPETSVVPGLSGDVRTTFWLSVGLFILVFIVLLVTRIGQVRDTRGVRETRELALDAGVLD